MPARREAIPQMWDAYDEAIELCLHHTNETSLATLAREAATLVKAKELTEHQALYEIAENGITGEDLQRISDHMADLL